MLKLPDHRDLRDETNWLAGLLDGEGCVYMGVSTRKHTTVRIDCWLYVGMTHKPTIELAAKILSKISGDPCRVKFSQAGNDPRGYNRRDKHKVSTSSKMGTLRALKALLPFLYTKQLEAALAIQFLERQTKSKKYTSTGMDRALVDLVRRLKRGDGEAPAEAEMALGYEVIPNQAVRDLRNERSGSAEGLQTSQPSSNGNAGHECPTTTDGDESVH